MDFEKTTARTVAECASEEVAAAFTKCFEGYLTGPVSVSAQSYERRFRAENLDPFASRLYLRGGAPAGILLVARRGWTSRVAAMGVAAEMRGDGLGKNIMRAAVEEAAERGDSSVLLEVFEQNEPAVNLYQGLGFRARRRLFGYSVESIDPETSDELVEIDPSEFARAIAREGDEEPPWMLSAETLAASTLPARAYHLERRAYALVGDAEAENMRLGALVVARDERRRGWGPRLVNALGAKFPGRAWRIPQLVPEGGADDFFTKLGWEREPLNQFEMHLDLSGERSG